MVTSDAAFKPYDGPRRQQHDVIPIPTTGCVMFRTYSLISLLLLSATLPGCKDNSSGASSSRQPATTDTALISNDSSADPANSAPLPDRARSPSASIVSANGGALTKIISGKDEVTTTPLVSLDELLLFHPAKFPQGNWRPEGIEFEDVWFKSEDGTKLHGWYCPHPEARACVLYLHGNAGNISHRSEIVAMLQQQLRLTVLIFDYRGYGRSEGVPTVDGILNDARAARRVLAHEAQVAPDDIVLMGRSLGGAVAVQLAAENAPRGLILESTFSSLKDVASHHVPWLSGLVPAARLNSVTQISQFDRPLLQSHGEADTVIPFALGRKLFESAQQPKQFVSLPARVHNDPQPVEYYATLDRFIESLVSPVGTTGRVDGLRKAPKKGR